MNRHSTPDVYSALVRRTTIAWRAGRISARTFGTIVNAIIQLRIDDAHRSH